MRCSAIALLTAIAAVTSSCDNANAVFQSYPAPTVVSQGDGGRRISNHGVDVWISGTPDRPFKAIGTIFDKRDNTISGAASRSAAIAKLVRQHGGDAAIVADNRSVPIGVRPAGPGGVFGTSSFSDQPARMIDGTWMRLVVIKYVGR